MRYEQGDSGEGEIMKEEEKKKMANFIDEVMTEWKYSIFPWELHFLWKNYNKKDFKNIEKDLVENKKLLRRIVKRHKKQKCGWCSGNVQRFPEKYRNANRQTNLEVV